MIVCRQVEPDRLSHGGPQLTRSHAQHVWHFCSPPRPHIPSEKRECTQKMCLTLAPLSWLSDLCKKCCVTSKKWFRGTDFIVRADCPNLRQVPGAAAHKKCCVTSKKWFRGTDFIVRADCPNLRQVPGAAAHNPVAHRLHHAHDRRLLHPRHFSVPLYVFF